MYTDKDESEETEDQALILAISLFATKTIP